MAGAAAVSDLALKLHLTAAALGCHGRKQLCARFRAVNPDTFFDLERSHKWLQGRATPRYPQVYDDWARVIRTTHPGAWIASCSIEGFLAELCALHDQDPAELLRRARTRMPAVREGGRREDAELYLCGTYACYSRAWSPYYRGQLIGGVLTLVTSRTRATLGATYTEMLLSREVRFEGEVLLGGRALHTTVQAPSTGTSLFMTLCRPGPPASVLCGVMSGASIIGPEALPSMTRLVAVRVPGPGGSGGGYLLPTEGTIAADLRAQGLSLSDPAGVDALIRDVLLAHGSASADQVTSAIQAQLAAALDRSYLVAAQSA